jgi:hypothetical protein
MNRPFSSLVVLGLVFLAAAAPRAGAATKVSEADFKIYRAVQYAEALRDARVMWARGDQAKREAAAALPKSALRDAGWTEERYGEVAEAVSEIHSALQSAKDGELTDSDLAATLAVHDATTVATVRAHFAEIQRNDDSQRADKQVRDEIEAERTGVPPTAAQLAGTWVFDAEASVELMLGGAPGEEGRKLVAELKAKFEGTTYVFAPGGRVTVRSRGADGREVEESCDYRLDGAVIIFTSETRKREDRLKAGLRNGKLHLGYSFGMIALSRK